MEEVREKIEAMFLSGDKSLWKLGRLMCHELRIDYYVYILEYSTKISKVYKYSLYNNSVLDVVFFRRVYHIKLSKWKSS